MADAESFYKFYKALPLSKSIYKSRKILFSIDLTTPKSRISIASVESNTLRHKPLSGSLYGEDYAHQEKIHVQNIDL